MEIDNRDMEKVNAGINNFYFDKHIMGKAGITFPKFVNELISEITDS